MPFTVAWPGPPAKPVPHVVRIVYAGEGRVDLGDGPRALPPSYERLRELRLRVPAGANRLRVDFRFVSQRGDADRPGPYAAFKLLDARRGTPVTAARAPWTLAAATLAAVLAALATMLLSYGRALGPAGLARVAAAAVAGTALGLATGAPGLVNQGGSAAAGLCVGAVLCAQSVRPWRHPLLVAFLALCGLMVVMALTADFEPSAVLYQPYGEDWLAYQGH